VAAGTIRPADVKFDERLDLAHLLAPVERAAHLLEAERALAVLDHVGVTHPLGEVLLRLRDDGLDVVAIEAGVVVGHEAGGELAGADGPARADLRQAERRRSEAGEDAAAGGGVGDGIGGELIGVGRGRGEGCSDGGQQQETAEHPARLNPFQQS
jgi:hypothetical protein